MQGHCGARAPQPGTGALFAPPRLVQVGDRLRVDIGLGFGHRGCQGLHSGLLQMRDRPQTHGNPTQPCHDVLGRTLRQVIRARAQCHEGLHAGTKAPGRPPTGRAARVDPPEILPAPFGRGFRYITGTPYLVKRSGIIAQRFAQQQHYPLMFFNTQNRHLMSIKHGIRLRYALLSASL